jgi:glutamate synthase domain-containing protein 2
VIVGALLGAEEFGFATAPLVVMGCVMMRVCHLKHCPGRHCDAGSGTAQDLQRQAEFVQNFFRFIAEEVRELMAELVLPHLQRDDRPRRVPLISSPRKITGRPGASSLHPVLFVPNP